MTERGAGALTRDATRLSIGRSTLCWDGTALKIAIDEIAVPLPRRIRGTVRVLPSALPGRRFPLDAVGRHVWTPLAPVARVEVRMMSPALTWSGAGYWDANAGDEPLEAGFRFWTWSRAALRDGTAVLYDADRRDGTTLSLSLHFGADGRMEQRPALPVAILPPTLWRLERRTRADEASGPTVRRTLEDAPFYARSELSTRLWREAAPAVHESLCLERFAKRWVKCLLPFRMPRRAGPLRPSD